MKILLPFQSPPPPPRSQKKETKTNVALFINSATKMRIKNKNNIEEKKTPKKWSWFVE